jgi:hypothetical protein
MDSMTSWMALDVASANPIRHRPDVVKSGLGMRGDIDRSAHIIIGPK